MRAPSSRSVRWRLTASVTLVVAVAMTGAVLWGTELVRDALVDRAVDDAFAQLELINREVGASPPPAFVQPELQLAAAAVGDLANDPAGAELFSALGVGPDEPAPVVLSDGTVVGIDATGQIGTVTSTDAAAITAWGLSDLSYQLIGASASLPAGFELADPELEYFTRDVGGRPTVAAVPTADIVAAVEEVRALLWAAAGAVVLAAIGATWFLTGRALRPVRRITEQVGVITHGTLHERVPVPPTGDEVAELARTMNGMLDRLERADQHRRRFVSDASHELRSPVAVIRSEAEAAVRNPAATTPAAVGGAVLEECDRLGRIVEDLLVLARADEMVAPPPRGLVDLDDVVLAETRRTRRVPVDCRAVSGGQVRAGRDEVARLVAHLVDNATRHARTQVAVSLHTSGDRVELVVDDDGDGIAAASRDEVFARFTRLEAARTRDGGGAGLGLAVVAATAASLGGTVAVTDAPLGGARFVVTLPVAGAPADQGPTRRPRRPGRPAPVASPV